MHQASEEKIGKQNFLVNFKAAFKNTIPLHKMMLSTPTKSSVRIGSDRSESFDTKPNFRQDYSLLWDFFNLVLGKIMSCGVQRSVLLAYAKETESFSSTTPA